MNGIAIIGVSIIVIAFAITIENSAAAFESPKHDDEAIEKQKDRYLRKIGDLEMQLDFAKRVSRKLGIEIPADD